MRRSFATLALAAANAISQVALAAGMVAVARISGATELGQLALILSISTVTSGLLDFGTNNRWVRERAAERLSAPDLSSLGSTKLAITVAASVVLSLGLGAGGVSLSLLLAPVTVCTVAMQLLQVPHRAAGRAGIQAACTLLDRSVFAIIFTALVIAGAPPAESLLLAITAGFLSDCSALFVISRKRHDWIGPLQFRNPWSGGARFGIASASSTAQNADVTVLHAATSVAEVGIFSAVNRWTQPMTLMASAVATSTASEMTTASSTRSALGRLASHKFILVATVLACLAVAASAPWTVAFILGEEFRDSAITLSLVSIAAALITINLPLATLLQCRGEETFVSITLSSLVGLYLGLVFVCGLVYGSAGAAASFLALQFLLAMGLSIRTAVTIAREERRGGGTHKRD